MLNDPGQALRSMAFVMLLAVTLAGCQGDKPAPPQPAPLVVQVDLEGSLKGVPEERRAAMRTCLDELQKLLMEIANALKWDLSGRTITLRLDNLGPDTGGETLPGENPGEILIKISRHFCDWPASLRRMVLAHELDHARVMDDPAHGNGTKTRRQLRAALEAAAHALQTLPPGTPTEERVKRLREELAAEIAYLEAKISEEERAYDATSKYGPGLGVSEDDLKNNSTNKGRVLDEMRNELEKRRKMLKKYGG